MKLCSQCRVLKPLAAFHKKAARLDGLTSACADCRNKSNRDQLRESGYWRARWAGLKALVIERYGGRCVCCGESEPVFLALDHKADDGAEHRRALGKDAIGERFYRWVIRAGFPDTLQLLCHNCNHAKRSGVCPHQLKNNRTQACDLGPGSPAQPR